MENFCNTLGDRCSKCWENGYAFCTIKLGRQEYYPEDFAIHDTITIFRHDHELSVETDIEVLYKTQFPYGSQAGKGEEFGDEQVLREQQIRDYLADKLPEGAKVGRFHLHYNPDRYDPKMVGLHIHVSKNTADLQDAEKTAAQLLDTIKPKNINPLLD